ncbi:MAG TPA: hypothetical protein VF897_06945 [Roseiflexaceae bacterium]
MPDEVRFDDARRRLDEVLKSLAEPAGAPGGAQMDDGSPRKPGGATGASGASGQPAPASEIASGKSTPTPTSPLDTIGSAAAGSHDSPNERRANGATTPAAAPVIAADVPSAAPGRTAGASSGGAAAPYTANSGDSGRAPASAARQQVNGRQAELDAAAVHPTPSSRPADAFTALTRLVIGAAVIGLDGLAQRAAEWERRAGLQGDDPPAAGGDPPANAGDIRHAMIGWIFETQEHLRPSGDPGDWLKTISSHMVGTVTTVIRESLPTFSLFGRSHDKKPEPIDPDTARWIARGQAEEQRSRAVAQVALEDLIDLTIGYLAGRPGVQAAIAELVRSPAMDDAIVQLARRDGVQQAVGELVHSPLIGDAVTQIVRSPAMEDAVRYLVNTPAMEDAIESLSESPALIELVQTQSTSFAGEILEEVRERGVSGDTILEGLARRLFRRPPRSALPPEARGLLVETEKKR